MQQVKFLTCETKIPGTKMSPNPRREKGLSHRANGEEFSRGTFRTIGSLERERHMPYEKLFSLHTDTIYQNWFLLY